LKQLADPMRSTLTAGIQNSNLDKPMAISYSRKRRWQNSIRKSFIR